MLGLAPAGTDPTSTGYYFPYELTPGNIYGCTFDPANDTARLYENGAEKEVNTNINFDAMFAASPFSGQSASVFINFGQQPFAYPVAGYETLYQTWSEWVIETLRSGLAEADALRSVLISHAMTYDAATDYCEGSVIKAFGQLWIAVNDAPATTYADIDALRSHVNWEQLNISA